MSLTTKVEEIVSEVVPDSTFVLSSPFWASVETFDYETTEFPIIILNNDIPKEAEIHRNANVSKDTRLIISVLYNDVFDSTNLASNTLQENAEAIADRIAVKLYQLNEIRPIDDRQRYTINFLYKIFQTQLTGASLEMRANENVIVNF